MDFQRFERFWRNVESITYVDSTYAVGSIPTYCMSLLGHSTPFCWSNWFRKSKGHLKSSEESDDWRPRWEQRSGVGSSVNEERNGEKVRPGGLQQLQDLQLR